MKTKLTAEQLKALAQLYPHGPVRALLDHVDILHEAMINDIKNKTEDAEIISESPVKNWKHGSVPHLRPESIL